MTSLLRPTADWFKAQLQDEGVRKVARACYLDDQKLDRQRTLTHDIVAACLAVEGCSGITFWGLTDRYSWLNSPRWGALRGQPPHYPLPFDADYRAKPMVAGILDAFAGR